YVVGHTGCQPVRQHRELVFSVAIQPAAQQRRAGLQHVVEGATPPDIGRLHIQRYGTGPVEAFQARATVFVHRGFVRTIAPAEQAAFVDRMERVDKDVGATKRNPSRDATIAERRNDVSFRSAGQAGSGQPCRQFGEEIFIHAMIIQKFALWMRVTVVPCALRPPTRGHSFTARALISEPSVRDGWKRSRRLASWLDAVSASS